MMTEQQKLSNHQVDERDLMLIKELEVNSRQSNRQLARKLGITSTTVQTRINRLVDAGMIRMTLIMDPVAMRFQTRAFFWLNIRPGSSDAAAEYLQPCASVQSMNLTTGRYDMMLFTVFQDQGAMINFIDAELSKVPGLINVEDMIVMKVMKRLWGQTSSARVAKEVTTPRDLDESDMSLIKELEVQPRETAINLGRKLGVSRKVISRKLAALMNDKVINVISLVNPKVLGIGVQATAFLKVLPGAVTSVATILSRDERVQHVMIVSGQFKVFIHANFHDMEELSSFLRNDLGKVPGVTHYETTIHVALLKQSPYLG